MGVKINFVLTTDYLLLLQIAGNRLSLESSIDFTPSVALYIWQSFRKGLWQAVQTHTDVTDVWMVAAEVCSTQGCMATSVADSYAFLPALLAVDPLQTVPADKLLDTNPSDPSLVFTLPHVEPMGRALWLFAQLLAAVAAERNSIFANITAPTGSIEHKELLHYAIASKLQQLTDTSCCTSVLLTDLTSAQGQAGAPHPLPSPSMSARCAAPCLC